MYRWKQGLGQTGPGPSSWSPEYLAATKDQQCAIQALGEIEAYESNVRAGAQAPGLQTISFTCNSPTKAFPSFPMSVPNTSDEIAQLQAQASSVIQFSPLATQEAQPGQTPIVPTAAQMNQLQAQGAKYASASPFSTPSQTVISSSSVPGTPPIQSGSSSTAQTSGFDFSSIPWWAWLAGAGAAVFAFSKS